MAEDPAAHGPRRQPHAGLGLRPADDVVVVHVGAGNEFRRWPEAAFAEVAGTLTARSPKRRIILTTGAAQAARAEEVRRLAVGRGVPARSMAVACDLDLAELRTWWRGRRCLSAATAGRRTSPSTTTMPMVVIFGPTHARGLGPLAEPGAGDETVDVGALPCRPCDQRRCEPGDFRCLRGIGARGGGGRRRRGHWSGTGTRATENWRL